MSRSGRSFDARPLAPGGARGAAVVLDEPLSLWGGMDVATGRIIDARHPQAGTSLARRIAVMPGGRGSSSSSSVLAEAIRLGTGPVGIVLLEADAILALGSLVAAELYGIEAPVVVLDEDAYRQLHPGATVEIAAGDETATVYLPEGSGP